MLKTNEKILWTANFSRAFSFRVFPHYLRAWNRRPNWSAADSFSEEANHIATFLRGRDKNNNSIPLRLERIKDTGKSLPSFANFGS